MKFPTRWLCCTGKRSCESRSCDRISTQQSRKEKKSGPSAQECNITAALSCQYADARCQHTSIYASPGSHLCVLRHLRMWPLSLSLFVPGNFPELGMQAPFCITTPSAAQFLLRPKIHYWVHFPCQKRCHHLVFKETDLHHIIIDQMLRSWALTPIFFYFLPFYFAPSVTRLPLVPSRATRTVTKSPDKSPDRPHD